MPCRLPSRFEARAASYSEELSGQKRPLDRFLLGSVEGGREAGRASPKVARDLPPGSRNSCRFWRVRRLQEGGHHGGRVGPSVAHARLAALSLLSSKKSIFLCPPSFPLSLYPTLSSLAELRLSLDMTADKGDGQRRRAILLGTDDGRAEIVQCQSRKKFSRGNPKKLFLASSLARMLPSPTLRRKTKVRPGGTTPGTNANVVRSVVIQCQCECEGLREGGVMQLMHHVQLCGGGAVRITGQGPTWVTICKVLHDSGPTRGLMEYSSRALCKF